LNRTKLLAKIMEKWPVKVLSLAAALIISIFYRMNTLETRFFNIPLIIESNETLLPASSFASVVRISLRGEADGIQQILDEDIEAFIDLGRYSNEGYYRVPVQIRKKGSALGVEPLEISVLPIEVPLMLEQKVTRNINVYSVTRGAVAEGYELKDSIIIPGSVVAEGPRGTLDSYIQFNTETINLDGRIDDFSIMVNIINDNPLISIHGNQMLEFRGTVSRIVREEEITVRQENIIDAEMTEEHDDELRQNRSIRSIIELFLSGDESQ